MTDTKEAPTAYLISTPNTEANNGTITTPPPKPVNAPRKPAVNDPNQTNNENSKILNFIPLVYKFILEQPDKICIFDTKIFKKTLYYVEFTYGIF
ncbi:hypothetical protein NUACC21_73800 [Scytonema sp. NUACC21]